MCGRPAAVARDAAPAPVGLNFLRLSVEPALLVNCRSGWQSEGGNALRPPVIRSGDLELDPSARAASRAGEVLHLTSAEYDILRLFIGSPGQVLTREKLVEHVHDRKFSPFDRSIDLHISNLRKKLGPHADGTERIRSIRGIGYLYTWPT